MKLPRYFEDPSTLHVGTEPNRAYYIPFREEETARLEDRLLSEELILLSGNWAFRYIPTGLKCRNILWTNRLTMNRSTRSLCPSCLADARL